MLSALMSNLGQFVASQLCGLGVRRANLDERCAPLHSLAIDAPRREWREPRETRDLVLVAVVNKFFKKKN